MRFPEKKIRAEISRIAKKYHHDIKYIDGRYVEDIVEEYQNTQDESLLLKILDNWSIFRKNWGRHFAPYCDNDVEIGQLMHDEVLWNATIKYNKKKIIKSKGRAFNAYLVSSMLNTLKNLWQARKSHKNHPRVPCPVCSEEVFQIDGKHLRHIITVDRYKRKYSKYPLVSTDGLVTCPMNGHAVRKITEPYLNRVNGSYTVMDFMEEYAEVLPKFPFDCPISNLKIYQLSNEFPAIIKEGYTSEQLIEEYPDYPGIITCPFTGEKMLEMTQEHLDDVLEQRGERGRYYMAKFKAKFQNATIKAKQVDVLNPYTNKMVAEITPEMLADAGKTVMDHLEEHASFCLDEFYQKSIVCPFTGRRTKRITKKDLTKLNRSTFDFYYAVCKYPLRKWHVKCAVCGEFVPNIWEHLAEVNHTYARSLTSEEFERDYGCCPTKAVVSTNSFYDSDSGDSVHVADLFIKRVQALDPLEIEDSLAKIASDDLDKRIAAALKEAQTFEDICFYASTKRNINLPFQFEIGKSRAIRDAVKKSTNLDDFDFVEAPQDGARKVEIMMPGRDSIHKRLRWLIEHSDLKDLLRGLQVKS